MTPEEEHEFIKKEVAWTAKQSEEKYQEMKIAEKRWMEATFRHDITYKALEDFYDKYPDIFHKEHPHMKGNSDDI